ncbi:9657_t:CDS:2, partial [Scutellospora calospora]
MPRISSKITIGEWVSFMSSVLSKELVLQYLQYRGGNWKNKRLYGKVIGGLNEGGRLKYRINVENFENMEVDVLAGNLRYEKPDDDELLSNVELLTVPIELSNISESSIEEDDNTVNEENSNTSGPSTTVNWKEQSITIDQREINLSYNQNCSVNIESIELASPFNLLCRYLPVNYIKQHIINSINMHGRETSNWVDINFDEYMRWLGLWVLMSAFPVADRRFYWRTTQDLTKPMASFNFQRWMPLSRFEQIVSCHTLMMICELKTPNLSDSLYPVRSFIDAFNKNLIEAVKPGKTLCIDESINSWLGSKNKIPGHRKIPRKPHPVGQEWKTVADGSTNIIIQVEPCEDKEIEKKKQFVLEYGNTTAYVLHLVRPWFSSGRTIVGDSWFGSPKLCIVLMQNGLYGIFHIKKKRGWPLNYPCDMVQKLGSAYGSYFSKVATINNIYLIAASLKDRKPQCIIASASTTTIADKIEHVVKEYNNSLLVKFTRLKIFYEYSCSKGAVDINNQANAFLTFKKWSNKGNNISHFDFRRLLADEM